MVVGLLTESTPDPEKMTWLGVLQQNLCISKIFIFKILLQIRQLMPKLFFIV